jgi:hypothetical protein
MAEGIPGEHQGSAGARGPEETRCAVEFEMKHTAEIIPGDPIRVRIKHDYEFIDGGDVDRMAARDEILSWHKSLGVNFQNVKLSIDDILTQLVTAAKKSL